MFEVIQHQPPRTLTQAMHGRTHYMTISAPIAPLTNHRGMSGHRIKAALLELMPEFGSAHIPQSGDTLLACEVWRTTMRKVNVSIQTSKRVHIDARDDDPLWINGVPATRSEREEFAKLTGWPTWNLFAFNIRIQPSFNGQFTGFLVTWESQS